MVLVRALVPLRMKGLAATLLRLFSTIRSASRLKDVANLVYETSLKECLEDYQECLWILIKDD